MCSIDCHAGKRQSRSFFAAAAAAAAAATVGCQVEEREESTRRRGAGGRHSKKRLLYLLLLTCVHLFFVHSIDYSNNNSAYRYIPITSSCTLLGSECLWPWRPIWGATSEDLLDDGGLRASARDGRPDTTQHTGACSSGCYFDRAVAVSAVYVGRGGTYVVPDIRCRCPYRSTLFVVLVPRSLLVTLD